MTSEELYAKWSNFSIEKSEEVNALIHGPEKGEAAASSGQRNKDEDDDDDDEL